MSSRALVDVFVAKLKRQILDYLGITVREEVLMLGQVHLFCKSLK